MKPATFFLWFLALSFAFGVWCAIQLWPWFSLAAMLFVAGLAAYFAADAKPPGADE